MIALCYADVIKFFLLVLVQIVKFIIFICVYLAYIVVLMFRKEIHTFRENASLC